MICEMTTLPPTPIKSYFKFSVDLRMGLSGGLYIRVVNDRFKGRCHFFFHIEGSITTIPTVFC